MGFGCIVFYIYVQDCPRELIILMKCCWKFGTLTNILIVNYVTLDDLYVIFQHFLLFFDHFPGRSFLGQDVLSDCLCVCRHCVVRSDNRAVLSVLLDGCLICLCAGVESSVPSL